MTNHLLPTATATEERDRGAGIALLPVGSFEQHGTFLPLATDTVIAVTVARAIGEAVDVFELPPVTVSCSHEHAAWHGTVSISAATLYAVVTDIAASLRASGVSKLVLVSGHGGNYVLGNVVQEAGAAGHAMALFPTEDDWARARRDAGVELSAVHDMHAGELETSIMLHAHPELVRADHAEHDHLADDRGRFLTLGLRAYTESGVIGRPSLASAGKGRDAVRSLVDSFAGVVDALDRCGR
ncbi:creatinine amidohydrolase [Actinophytocola xinjiangensis]|uniref:Creatinine amidohydrolase n=1 Tax=Actinophytocola xinjiangensis TaxID=485602 RepID=A0A7Z0WRG7_9PSEU|nr:creatininase family protein [Actinophytocola xinjiangensis]OLF12409.1 creatinine amidohydrolase [Actinophytocola xinjiangensis]